MRSTLGILNHQIATLELHHKVESTSTRPENVINRRSEPTVTHWEMRGTRELLFSTSGNN